MKLLSILLALVVCFIVRPVFAINTSASIQPKALFAEYKKKGEKVSKIVVVGAGYVGLVTGACLAQKGNFVVIVENNQAKIDALLQGKIPFYEPWLDTIVTEAIAKKTLVFESSLAKGLAHQPSIVFSCVGTPPLADGSADLSFVEHVAHEVGQSLQHYTLIVTKSTVPVGTARTVKTIIEQELAKRNVAIPFDVASNPEFLKEGDAVNDFLTPDRIVVGVESEKAAALFYDLYKPFITSDEQLLIMNIESAELCKYASNAMLATRISFMNQMALLADLIGADIEHVKQGMGRDARIGSKFLEAGVGFGGSCFPKDVDALITMGKKQFFPMTLVQEVNNINKFQRTWFINRIISHYGPSLSNKTIGIWGLAFKPETDDIRCSPALDVIQELLPRCKNIIAYDPVAQDNVKALVGNQIMFAPTADHVLQTADFLIVLTNWKEFVIQTPDKFAALSDKTVFDGRNCFDPYVMLEQGITYFCVGRNSLIKPNNNNHYVAPTKHSVTQASL